MTVASPDRDRKRLYTLLFSLYLVNLSVQKRLSSLFRPRSLSAAFFRGTRIAHRYHHPPAAGKPDASALATGQTQRYDALLDFHTLGPQHRPEESIHGRLPPGCGCWRGSEDRCRPRLRASESGIAPAVSLLWGSLCAPRICCSDGARSLWDCRPRRPAARAQSWNWSSCRLLTSREHGCRPRGTRSTSLGCRRRPLSHCRQALSWSAHT